MVLPQLVPHLPTEPSEPSLLLFWAPQAPSINTLPTHPAGTPATHSTRQQKEGKHPWANHSNKSEIISAKVILIVTRLQWGKVSNEAIWDVLTLNSADTQILVRIITVTQLQLIKLKATKYLTLLFNPFLEILFSFLGSRFFFFSPYFTFHYPSKERIKITSNSSHSFYCKRLQKVNSSQVFNRKTEKHL